MRRSVRLTSSLSGLLIGLSACAEAPESSLAPPTGEARLQNDPVVAIQASVPAILSADHEDPRIRVRLVHQSGATSESLEDVAFRIPRGWPHVSIDNRTGRIRSARVGLNSVEVSWTEGPPRWRRVRTTVGFQVDPGRPSSLGLGFVDWGWDPDRSSARLDVWLYDGWRNRLDLEVQPRFESQFPEIAEVDADGRYRIVGAGRSRLTVSVSEPEPMERWTLLGEPLLRARAEPSRSEVTDVDVVPDGGPVVWLAHSPGAATGILEIADPVSLDVVQSIPLYFRGGDVEPIVDRSGLWIASDDGRFIIRHDIGLRVQDLEIALPPGVRVRSMQSVPGRPSDLVVSTVPACCPWQPLEIAVYRNGARLPDFIRAETPPYPPSDFHLQSDGRTAWGYVQSPAWEEVHRMIVDDQGIRIEQRWPVDRHYGDWVAGTDRLFVVGEAIYDVSSGAPILTVHTESDVNWSPAFIPGSETLAWFTGGLNAYRQGRAADGREWLNQSSVPLGRSLAFVSDASFVSFNNDGEIERHAVPGAPLPVR